MERKIETKRKEEKRFRVGTLAAVVRDTRGVEGVSRSLSRSIE